MTKRDQVDAVAKIADITPAQARDAIDAVCGLIKVGLLEEERFTLSGVGVFTVERRRQRNVTNPHTGVMMTLPATAVVKFRPTPDLTAKIKERHSA